MSNQDAIIRDVVAERERIAALYPNEEHMPNGTGNAGMRRYWAKMARGECERAVREGRVTHLLVFDEETAEAMEEDDDAKLEAELLQVMAVSLRWIEDIRSRRAAMEGNAP